jgi:DNA-binding SARP family transcriptional activator
VYQPETYASLGLLGGFECYCGGERVCLPRGPQRLLALLAIKGTGISRSAAAEELWPGSRRGRAAANLRSALSRIKNVSSARLIEEFGGQLYLAPGVVVDVRSFTGRARGIIAGPVACGEESSPEHMIAMLSRELLPDWYDDWLMVARERWSELRLHALEALARQLMLTQNWLNALEAALAAAAIEPVRETAHRLIVEIHIAEGNAGCALKHFQRYRRLLQRELDARPSTKMTQLINGLQSA